MRKPIKMHLIGNSYKEILESVNDGYIYVGRNHEVVILINREEQNSKCKGIAYSLLTHNVASFETSIHGLKKMYKDLLSKIIDEQYKLEQKESKLEDNILTALIAIDEWSYKNYRARKLS